MQIISDANGDEGAIPNAVGTPNATQDVYRHVKPGRKRANFFRYFRFNFPRFTKALLVLVIFAIGASAAAVAVYAPSDSPFPGGKIALGIVSVLAAIYVLIALTTRLEIWDYGSMISAGACIVYIGGVIGNAPYIWNGASIYLAATWNAMFFASLFYFILNWAVNFGMIVAWPKTQGFTD